MDAKARGQAISKSVQRKAAARARQAQAYATSASALTLDEWTLLGWALASAEDDARSEDYLDWEHRYARIRYKLGFPRGRDEPKPR